MIINFLNKKMIKKNTKKNSYNGSVINHLINLKLINHKKRKYKFNLIFNFYI